MSLESRGKYYTPNLATFRRPVAISGDSIKVVNGNKPGKVLVATTTEDLRLIAATSQLTRLWDCASNEVDIRAGIVI